MNGKTYGINWMRQNVPSHLKSTVHMIIDSQLPQDDQILSNGDADVAGDEYLITNGDENDLDQIAAENLIFMARDGQMVAEIIETATDENGTVVVSASDGTPIDYEAVLQQAALQQVVAIAANTSSDAGRSYVEEYGDDTPQMVTEEVITDDWVQHQGEERVEISEEQIVGSGSQDIQDIEVPLPTVQDEYTALRPYPCDFCSRRFRKKSSLMNHMISSHQNDKPHLCKLCGSRFFRRSDLINHLKAHADNDNTDIGNNEFTQFTNEQQQHETNTRTTSDHYYDQEWHSEITAEDFIAKSNRKSNVMSCNSSSTSSVHVPAISRGRISRLKLKDYIVHEHSEEMATNTDMDYIECQQLQASTAAVKLSQDQSPDNQKHYPIINDSKPFVCQQCGLAFAREKALSSHSKNHHTDTQLECNQCNEVFWDHHSLQEHQKTHQFEDSNSEYDPGEAEESQSESDNGQVYAEFYCSECGISFHRQDLLRRHEKSHIKNNAGNADNIIDTGKDGKHCCNTCGETFGEALDLLAHAEIHARYPPFKCLLCGESFFEEHTIKRHLQSVHASDLTPNSCILCGKECRDRKALMKHAWDHSREKCHSCSKCGKNFHNKARLKRHMASHRDKSVICDVCHEEFPDGRSLSNHRHSHSANSGGKLFPCHECGKTFGSRSSQQIHVRIHTGERPYGCRFCWKAFADGGTLRKHERIHTGEKPYACSVCPRAFNQRVVLREHIRSHHSGLDPKRGSYFCTVCLSELSNSNDLIQHLIGHSDKNTAMQRAPVTGPRKYKRRRKLKPHEIAHLRNESKQNGNGSDIDISDFDMDNVDDLLGITENTTTSVNSNTSNKSKSNRPTARKDAGDSDVDPTAYSEDIENDKNAEYDDVDIEEEEKEQIDVSDVESPIKKHNSSDSNSSEKPWQNKTIQATKRNEVKSLFANFENSLHAESRTVANQRQTRAKHSESTAQRTHQVQYIKMDTAARTTASKTRKKTEKLLKQARPRMIHTEKQRSTANEGSSKRRGTKKIVTRTNTSTSTTSNIELLASSTTIVDDYEIISPATQPPNQISSSPLHIKQEQNETIHHHHHHHQQQELQQHHHQQQKMQHQELQLRNSPQMMIAATQSTRNNDLYDAQLLLEASTLRKNIYEKFNPSIVNDLEEILGSPIKTDKSERQRFTSESSTTQFLTEHTEEEHIIKIEPTSPDLREIVTGSVVSCNSVTATTPDAMRRRNISTNRKYLEFDGNISNSSSMSNNSNIIITHSMPQRLTASNFIVKNVTSTATTAILKSPTSAINKSTYHSSYTDDAFNTANSVDTSSYFSISAVVSAADASAAAAAAATANPTQERRQRMFECEMCSAVFSDRAQLLDHVHIHI